MNTKLFALTFLPIISACSSGPFVKAELDNEVKRLCAIDGGLKSYQTVELPNDKFNEHGQINFWIPSRDKAKSNDEYYYERIVIYIKKGNPELSRTQHKIIRKKDNKLLGESIRYARGGGDSLGPWHDSTFICPKPSTQTSLEALIFLRSGDK